MNDTVESLGQYDFLKINEYFIYFWKVILTQTFHSIIHSFISSPMKKAMWEWYLTEGFCLPHLKTRQLVAY